MGSKYKSPLIRSSRNASAAAAAAAIDDGPSPNAVASTAPQSLTTVVRTGCPPADDRPQPSPVGQRTGWRGRGCSSPRFNGSPRPPRGSPYQWTSPACRFNNSWSLDRSNASSYASQEKNGCSPYKSHHNKTQNTSNWNNESSDESYFHPSMLEDPWAPLLNSSAANIAE